MKPKVDKFKTSQKMRVQVKMKQFKMNKTVKQISQKIKMIKLITIHQMEKSKTNQRTTTMKIIINKLKNKKITQAAIIMNLALIIIIKIILRISQMKQKKTKSRIQIKLLTLI